MYYTRLVMRTGLASAEPGHDAKLDQSHEKHVGELKRETDPLICIYLSLLSAFLILLIGISSPSRDDTH